MKLSPVKLLTAASLLAAFAVFFLWSPRDLAAVAQEPPAGPAAEPDAAGQNADAVGRGGGRGRGGRGRGAAPVDTLGEGPWDLDTELGPVHVEVVTKGLDRPWGMAFLPGGDMLVTERGGRLRVIRGGVLDPTPIGPLPEIRTGVLGGLMDIALHPDFEENRLVYFVYSKPGPLEPARATTAVARARWDGGSTLEDLEDVFVADAWHGGRGAARRCCGQGPSDGSYGSRIVFDADGFLYVTLGDRNYGEMAQNTASHLGKIMRLTDDGTAPPDNPFAGMAAYLPEIYTLGHRNPLGLTIDPATGVMWSTEFGPRGGDELNRIEAGNNYGWILVTEGMHYNGEPASLGANSVDGMVDPVLFWAPSINPGNPTFYHGDKLPQWEGHMLMATMTRSLLRATFDAEGNPLSQERMLTELGQRFRDARTGPDGYVYLLTDETIGAVLRIEPAP